MAELLLEKQQEPARLRIYLGQPPGWAKPITCSMTPTSFSNRAWTGDRPRGDARRKEHQDQIRDIEIVPQR